MGSRLEQKSNLIRKRIEGHSFQDERGEEYEPSKFGGFPEYFRRKKIKLQNLDAELRAGSDKPQIFQGIVCHINGYTQPSLNDLHVMIVQHGGGFIQYLDGKTMVTHIIASNLTPKKKEEFKRYRIVKPAWIVDSIKADKLLAWDAYRVIDEGRTQKVLGFENGQVVSSASRKSTGYKEQTDTSWYTHQLATGQSLAPTGKYKLSESSQASLFDGDIQDDDFPSGVSDEFADRAGIKHSVEGEQSTKIILEHGDPLQHSSTVQPPLISHPRVEPMENDTAVFDPSMRPNNAGSRLESREGSQEPDYSMAVVANSEILNSIPHDQLATMSAEEHNALLLSDPHIRKSTVVHPGFLEQYYRESRLHHLSTWKADLKAQLQALAAERSSQHAKPRKAPGQRRYIIHVDFDSFFAAVSLKRFPQYAAKPAVVAHGGGSGSEIASCNYPARKYGVKNGMWMRRAQELCPDLRILPYDFPAYEDASRKFYDSIMSTTGIVQSVSVDEALVDISAMCFAAAGTDGIKRNEGGVYREQCKADEIAQNLRDEVYSTTGCAVSVGIGGNILQAKVALRKAKPAGQYHLKPEDVLDFIGILEVQALPGIAWSIGGKLEEIGIKLVKDVRECSREKLVNTLGPKTGEKVWDYARGIDKVEVGDQVVRKSVSAEVNWGVRFENQEQVDEFMVGLSDELHKRLVKERVKGKQITLKVMRRGADAPRDPPKHLGHGKCDTYNKSTQLGVATNDATFIAKEAIAMIKSLNISPGELRGIGLQMQKLDMINPGNVAQSSSSQRRLQFKSGPSHTDEKIQDMPLESSIGDVKTTDQRQSDIDNEFHEIEMAKGTTTSPYQSSPKKKPLNIAGTQFLLPTQADPRVLDELPEFIKAKLARRTQQAEPTMADKVDKASVTDSPPSRKAQAYASLIVDSGIDPEILNALPDDVRAEVLAVNKSPRKHTREQSLLPQSPHAHRTVNFIKQNTKRKKGRGKARVTDGNPTLTQTNFVARPSAILSNEDIATSTDTEAEPEEVDQSFLDALPEDIRKEVMAQQRQMRLQRTGGIDTSMHERAKARGKKPLDSSGAMDVFLRLPARRAKATFTSAKLSSVQDLRDAMKAWYSEFSDEGPYDEDVSALTNYLKDVLLMEKNIDKVVTIMRWLHWLVEEGGSDHTCSVDTAAAWQRALISIGKDIQDAATQRGLGQVDLF